MNYDDEWQLDVQLRLARGVTIDSIVCEALLLFAELDKRKQESELS